MSLSDTVADAPSAAAPRLPEGQGRVRRREPRTYDFRRPTKLSREHVRILQITQESFARQATTTLTSLLRTGVRVELTGIEQFSYDDYIATLPASWFVATFTLEPLAGKGVLAWPLDTAMAMVDHMLGGSGAGDQPNRPMTGMESSITGHLLARLLDELGQAFAPVTTLAPTLDSVEYNPQLAQAASGSETVMVATYSMRIGAREPEVTLVLPFSSFAGPLNNAASPQLSETAKHKRQRALEAITERLNDVPVDVSVRFNPLEVPSGDLLSLAVGDVLLLRHAQDSPLQVTTNDVTFAHALPSNHRRRLAAEIVPDTATGGKDPA
ncbi:flagellar motor switch protein FliM [Modestobacter sp. VKM Ac-2983]|uniref:flagellar motor switch protein FliM n=1 Tax=Modestobacter sp. VKM Ac-2983 TaxID=3004137 RepID=UPI0022AB61AA|nr:flagellar motor switch protein FliM [Modestobacter sp. VKM Ac-2983]MCZ2804161.1 flagellar motor switch protein FliM [Modestobacter sp. VKM Ac-2983]